MATDERLAFSALIPLGAGLDHYDKRQCVHRGLAQNLEARTANPSRRLRESLNHSENYVDRFRPQPTVSR